MAKQIYKNKKLLCVLFEINGKSVFNVNFFIVKKINEPKINRCFDEMARKKEVKCVLFDAKKVVLTLVFAISRTSCFSKISDMVILW